METQSGKQESEHLSSTQSSESPRNTEKVSVSCNSTGSTLKERDYIGIYEVSSREKQDVNAEARAEEPSHMDQVELRLSLSDTVNGCSFSGFKPTQFEQDGKNAKTAGVKRAFSQICSGDEQVVENSKNAFLHMKETNHTHSTEDVGATRGPVGWPPVQSFRKSTVLIPQLKKKVENKTIPGTSTQSEPPSRFVKVNMDGVPIGRKVEIMSCNSYDSLTLMIEEMFQHHINGQNAVSQRDKLPASSKLNFIDSEHVLAYEDKDGDLMLVGDVPWRMFLETVKRLRIMKGTDTTGLASKTTL